MNICSYTHFPTSLRLRYDSRRRSHCLTTLRGISMASGCTSGVASREKGFRLVRRAEHNSDRKSSTRYAATTLWQSSPMARQCDFALAACVGLFQLYMQIGNALVRQNRRKLAVTARVRDIRASARRLVASREISSPRTSLWRKSASSGERWSRE